MQGTRKLDCPATLQVRAIQLYTDYTLAVNKYSSKKSLRKAKALILDQLKNDVQKGKFLGTLTRYYFKLPLSTMHKEHAVGKVGTVRHSNTSTSHLKTSPMESPSQTSNSTKARRRLLERIDVLRSAASMTDDSAALENAMSMVDTVITELQRSSPHENGLPLRQSPVKKKIKITQLDYHKVIHKKLPACRRHGKRKKDGGMVVDI